MAPNLLLKELSLNNVFCRLVEKIPDSVLISYPSHTLDFKDFTAADLDKLTKAVITTLPEYLRAPTNGISPGERPVVAVVGVSNLEYHIYFLALQRLGWRTLLMSPRLADQGFAHLIRQTKCKTVLVSGVSAEAMKRVRSNESFELDILAMLDLQRLEEVCQEPPNFNLPFQELRHPSQSPQLIIHSSGTTGLPKPVPLNSGEWLLQNAALVERIPQYDTLTTLPVFHSFGIGSLFRMLLSGRKLSIMSAERSITASSLLEALGLTKSKTLVTVPHVLKFCAEAEGGPERLAQLDSVVLAGSAVPQQLGDELVEKGVTISTIYGQTESGGLMQPGTGKEWCWVSPLPHAESFMKFEPVEGKENICHLVILPGLPTKMLSNRSDGSYGTNDLFERHPSDPRKWKFAGRADDIIVLVNGEKADPTPLEQALSLNVNVHTAVVFGAGFDSLGVLLIPSNNAAGLPKEKLIDNIKPSLDLGNTKVPAYARVSPDSVIVKDIGFEVPMTAKSTLIRSKLIELCRRDIEEFYARRSLGNEVQVTVADEDVEGLVRETIKSVLLIGDEKLTDNCDFFFMGMDSLQASHVRSRLLRQVNLNGHSLPANVAFEYPTISRLTQHLLDIRNDRRPSGNPETAKLFAESLVQKYTKFPMIKPRPTATASRQIVLLTGATGTIGCHILHHLARQPSIYRIHCLIRAKTDAEAKKRITKSITDSRLNDLDDSQMSKIVTLAAILGEPHFGLNDRLYELLRSSVTTIIHGAWAVNFNMSLRSFEEPYITSVSHLLNLAMKSSLSSKPTFCFLSSVASALRVKDCPIREVQYDWDATSYMGYGQSKWVAEKICDAAAQYAESCGIDLPIKILRIGQVSGDTRHGIWNPTETIPIMVQSAITTGVLPITDGPHDNHFWLPVDLAAGSIIELALHKPIGTMERSARVFHVANTTPVRWTSEFLPALRRHGMLFEAVPASDWLRRLENPDAETEGNPTYRLLGWFKRKFEPKGDFDGQDDKLEMDLTVAKQHSSTLRNGVKISDEMIGKFLRYWTQLDGWS
ncbi:hypothetical protein NUW58_g1276 [Xylaria curta]|uniref:Uncharacterized protein n=1 Tax=Xylaria curta TaxID=42375 RepID=A0ACC1PLW1_9PEZI|nr:hypothetical protein NUW58_g1276 [Xylaria curta]